MNEEHHARARALELAIAHTVGEISPLNVVERAKVYAGFIMGTPNPKDDGVAASTGGDNDPRNPNLYPGTPHAAEANHGYERHHLDDELKPGTPD